MAHGGLVRSSNFSVAFCNASHALALPAVTLVSSAQAGPAVLVQPLSHSHPQPAWLPPCLAAPAVLMGPVKALTYLLVYGVLSITLGTCWAAQLPWAVCIPVASIARWVQMHRFAMVGSATKAARSLGHCLLVCWVHCPATRFSISALLWFCPCYRVVGYLGYIKEACWVEPTSHALVTALAYLCLCPYHRVAGYLGYIKVACWVMGEDLMALIVTNIHSLLVRCARCACGSECPLSPWVIAPRAGEVGRARVSCQGAVYSAATGGCS